MDLALELSAFAHPPERLPVACNRSAGIGISTEKLATIRQILIAAVGAGGPIVALVNEDLDGVALELVKVPSGTFEMGSPNSEAQRANHEGPQHSVTAPEFFMGRFEVTREQWRQVANMSRVKIDLKEDPSNFKDSLKQPHERAPLFPC